MTSPLIGHSQARNMAEQNWGTGGTTSSRTNRPGVFYFSCSGHGGFVIDADALSTQEQVLIDGFLPHGNARLYHDEKGNIRRFMSPFRTKSRSSYVRLSWTRVEKKIYLAEEDCNWAIPVLYCAITTRGMTTQDALDSYKRWHAPSAHELLKVHGILQARDAQAT